ncbi:hypothetical protein V2G26_012148 [Clonostachys chloroleuca]
MRVPAVLAAAAAVATPALGVAVNNESIIVMEAPDHVRPYVLPKFRGKATKLAETQVIRYSITNNSSGGAFALLQHTGNVRGYTSARPHRHHEVQEHFYCSRGRVQLWGMKDEANASHEARVATVGDYGSIPPYGIHTFQLTDPDSSLTHVFHPAGFEHLFEVFSSGDFDTTGISSSFVPAENDNPPSAHLRLRRMLLCRVWISMPSTTMRPGSLEETLSTEQPVISLCTGTMGQTRYRPIPPFPTSSRRITVPNT